MTSNGYRPFPAPGPVCASFADLLPLLGEDALDAQAHEHLRQHVGTCAYCQAQVALDIRVAGAFRRSFEPPALRLFSQEELMKITENEERTASAARIPSPAPTSMRPRSRRSGWMRTYTAIAAIAAVVALFVVLFQGFGPGHGHSQTGTRQTSTVAPSPTSVPDESYRVPFIAPTNPQIVYQLAPTSPSSNQLALQRSVDSGQTWHSFSLPAQSNGPRPTIFISPLDAQTVFVSLGGKLVNNTCVPQQPISADNTLSAGDHVCGLQYVSQDGGAHWTQLHFPSNDILGGFALPTSFAVGSAALQAQGTRLYSALGPWIFNPAGQAPGPQLVASDDGGLSWQVVDNDLPLTTSRLCDAAPAPTGNIIFALVASGSQCLGKPLTLWRSDDAGAHWGKVAQLTNDVDLGMVVVSSGNAEQPLLYANVGSSTCPTSAYIASSPASGICGGSPTDLQVSADGGKTWQPAPTQGYPDQKRNPGHPQGVLSDGAVLFLVNTQFYTWKASTAAWHRLGPTVSENFYYALVTTSRSGQQTLWVVTSPGASAFTIKGYPL